MKNRAGFGAPLGTQYVKLTPKQKAKLLTSTVNKYSQNNLKRALWRWYLHTNSGESHIKKTVSQLALCNNIQKDVAAYRLFKLVRPYTFPRGDLLKAKRVSIVLFLLTRQAALKKTGECFERMKHVLRDNRLEAARKVEKAAMSRAKGVFALWRNTNKIYESRKAAK